MVQICTYKTAQLFGQFGQMVKCEFQMYVVLGSSLVAM